MSKIDDNLQSKYKELLTVAASLSPPEATLFARTENLSRSSPFGTLSESANRRVFAYLIATLNANWRDYDFSNTLTPDDFTVVKLYHAQAHIEEKIYGAHSRQCLLNMTKNGGSYTPGGSTMWRPQMWGMISEEMALSECTVYRLTASENPFDEGPELWSFHYFFYNKLMKRVCYLWARASDFSIYDLTHPEPPTPTPKRILATPADYDFESDAFGADKRAKYWLGKRAADAESYVGSYASTSDVIQGPGDSVVDREVNPLAVAQFIRSGRSMTPISISSDSDDDVQIYASRVKTPSKPAQPKRKQGQSDTSQSPTNSQKGVRSMSVSIVESMEV